MLEILHFFIFIAVIPLLGFYIAHFFTADKPIFHSFFGSLENLCYKISGINPHEEMDWKIYGKNLLAFNIWGAIFLFLFQVLQGFLPLNPERFSGVPWPLAFNTTASFVTNTNWQAYAGETTLSYFTQMVGLTSQNFLSASTGFTALLVLIRGISRSVSQTVGNFWRDLVRSILYLFLPLSIIFSLFLVHQGVIQTFAPYVTLTTLENHKQTIPLGPVASQVAIKQLGTNGGGFFNANSAHPFENPTPLSNSLETWAILLIPAATVIAYGRMIGSLKEGWLIFIAMLSLWLIGSGLSFFIEEGWEGKETRIGILSSLLWTISTTATANGSVNSALSSLSPLSTGIALTNMKLGEVIFGGVGVGLCIMLMYIILTVFMSGLMVGRSPEYLGKKIEKKEMQWVIVAILLPSALILMGSSYIAATIQNFNSPHALTQILYTFASTAENNGSNLGLNVDTPFYNLILGVVILMGRASIILPSLAIGGLLARKKRVPYSKGTLSTSHWIFGFMLVGTIMIVGGLTFFPSLALGPILDYFLMKEGKFY